MVETKRGTSDPTYLYYTLGKLEIMKLRDDVKKKQGAAFSLQKFHDDFLRQGFPPIKMVREALLGDDSPALLAGGYGFPVSETSGWAHGDAIKSYNQIGNDLVL